MIPNGNDEYVVIIPEHPPLSEARKDICYGTNKPYLGEHDEVSEWAMIYAFQNYKVGQEVSLEEMEARVIDATTAQVLSALVDSGWVEMSWSDKHGEPVYRITKQGRDAHEKKE